MRVKSMVLILIALGCGLVASIGISQVMDRNSNRQDGPAVEMVPILVAMTDLNIGDKLDAQNVKLEDWPKDRLPKGSIRSLEEVADSAPRMRFYIGEPILTHKLMNDDQGDVVIPEGYRVVPVKISSETVTELVQPGDRIDILVYLPRSGEVSVPSTRTVLRDVRIYAVGIQVERIVDREGQSMSAKTVSLIVKPAQVELLMLAGEMGKLKLSLRRHNDTSDGELSDRGTTLHDLIRSNGDFADERQPDVPGPQANAGDQESLQDLLDRLGQTGAAAAPPVVDNEVKTTMVVLTPDGTPVEYQWNSDNKLIGMATRGGVDGPPVDSPTFQPPFAAPQGDAANGGEAAAAPSNTNATSDSSN